MGKNTVVPTASPTEESEDAEVQAKGELKRRTPISKTGAVRFVIGFLLLTVVFLSVGRYTVNTAPMNWYLFQVARQSAFILGLLGDTSFVENPDAYRDRSAEMRAQVQAWRQAGNTAPDTANEAPVSAYEVWTYRAAKIAHDYESEKHYLALTDPLAPLTRLQTPDRIARARENLDRLIASTKRADRPNATPVMVKGLKEVIAESETVVVALESGAVPAEGTIQEALLELESQLERARVAQRAFLESRVTNLTTQIQDRLGPLVTFVASNNPEQPRRFNFHLVPDCGALPSMSIYVAALLAFPASFRKRALGLLVGLPILYLINIIRLVCLALIGAWAQNPEVFEFAHQYVWQAIYILLVVGVWLLWVETIVRPEATWRKTRTSPA